MLYGNSDSVAPLAQQRVREDVTGIISQCLAANRLLAGITPCFDGDGFDAYVIGNEPTCRQVLLLGAYASDPFGVPECSSRFLDRAHPEQLSFSPTRCAPKKFRQLFNRSLHKPTF